MTSHLMIKLGKELTGKLIHDRYFTMMMTCKYVNVFCDTIWLKVCVSGERQEDWGTSSFEKAHLP